jgi:hypothetical protein
LDGVAFWDWSVVKAVWRFLAYVEEEEEMDWFGVVRV